jgi:HAE1 family hydrophobic/amphiphilic exporter-1
MGQAVIGGIITSSLLTLVVVPVAYTYLDDFAAWAKRKWQGKQAHRETSERGQGSHAVTVPQSKNDDIV